MKHAIKLLPSSERMVYRSLESLGSWRINPDIAEICGIMHNYCSKLLSFLIKKGMVESRRVVRDGKTMHYSEYRIKPIDTPRIEDSKNGTQYTTNAKSGETSGIVQVSEQCVDCGSYYRVKNSCNICGKEF